MFTVHFNFFAQCLQLILFLFFFRAVFTIHFISFFRTVFTIHFFFFIFSSRSGSDACAPARGHVARVDGHDGDFVYEYDERHCE